MKNKELNHESTKGRKHEEFLIKNSDRCFFVLSPFRVFVICLFVAIVFIGGMAASAQDQARPTFIVNTLNGPLPPAPLEKLGEDGSIQLGGKAPRTFFGKEWVSLRQDGVSLLPYPQKNCVLLTGGDRILLEPGAPMRVEDEQLFIRPEHGTEIKVPLPYLSYLCMRVPEGVDDPDLFLDRLDKAKRSRDVLHLKNGDRIQGALATPTRGPIFRMNLGDRTVEIPQDQLAILAVNSEYQAHPKSKKPFAHIVTTGGARLQFSSVQLDSQRGMLLGKTLFGAKMEIPLERVAALSMRQGQAVYLSDLAPKRYEFTPFLGIKWPLALDANVAGRQLSLGSDYYDKGLGMHAQSQVTYALEGNCLWFEALAGLEGTAGSGQAQISVLVDGKKVIGPKELNGRNPILPVRIDVANGRELTLLVEFGNFGDVHGRVNWADARLIRDLE